jgi:hypothetical protein
MSKLPNIQTFNITVGYNDDIDLIQKFLQLYLAGLSLSDVTGKFHVRKKLVEVLTLYVYNGYSDKTKELVRGSASVSYFNLNQINSELSNMNLLVRYSLEDDENGNKVRVTNSWKNSYRELHPNLIKLREYVLNKQYDNIPALLVGFKRR